VSVASEWVRQDLIRHYGLEPDKVRVVRLAPPVQAYPQPSDADLIRIRSKLGLPDAFLFYPAQTWAHKNHTTLLRALALLRDRHGLEVPLVCSGQTTPFLRTLDRAAAELGLTAQVRFLGFRTPLELQCLYRLCRALIITSEFEAGSFPIMEAFSIGVPVACSRVTSLPEEAGDAALLFDPRDPQQIAEATRRLWTDPRLRARLIDRGRRRIRGLGWEHTARVFRAHYRRIAGRRLTEEDFQLVSANPPER